MILFWKVGEVIIPSSQERSYDTHWPHKTEGRWDNVSPRTEIVEDLVLIVPVII